jgi:serine/threonine protein kinase
MAEIYRAKTFGAAGFEKEYAIKLIIPSLVDDTEFVEMFINEAKIVVNLYHANIVQVFDLGEIDGQYYIAMEYVHGMDLLEILARCAKRKIKIPLNLVLFITMEMLKGLNFAHSAKDPYGDDLNIIHRDVSPSNIMISYAGDVKVGDFGVAKAAIQRSLTHSDTLKGKVGYMSPEQVMGEEINSRSDIFSAGIVFFEALSMSRLFVGESDLDVMLEVRDAEIDEALETMVDLPSDLEEILRSALAKDPDDRFQSASDFYQALVDFCYKHSIKVTGNDLSNMMSRLFAEEIEEEKSKRRIETNASPHEAFGMESSGADDSEIADESEGDDIGAELTEVDEDSREASSASDPAAESEQIYRFRAADGEIYGPYSRTELVDLIQNRIPHPEDRIQVGDGGWKPVGEFDALAGLVPNYSDVDEDTDRSIPIGARVFKKSSSVEPIDSEERPLEEPREVGSIQSTEAEDDAAPPSQTGIGAGKSLEASVRAMEEISVQFTEESEQQADEEPDDDDAAERAFESEPSSADHESDSLEAIQSTPAEVESITALKDQYASYEGELSETAFPRVFGRLHLTGATGRLHVVEDDVEKSVFLREGKPILVDSSKKEELLGSFLMSRGIIDQDQLDRALARLHEWGGRLGDALVAIGAVPAHDIYDYLAEQMREKLLDIFAWTGGHYGYYENQEPDTKGYPLGIDTLQLIADGCRNYVPFDYLVDYYEDRLDVDIRRRDTDPFELDRLELDNREQELLEQLLSPTTLSELLDEFGSTRESRVYRSVYLLEQLEVLRFEDTDSTPLSGLD